MAAAIGVTCLLVSGLVLVGSGPTSASVGTAWVSAVGALPSRDLAGDGPASGSQAALDGQTACPSANLCFAVGGYLDSARNTAGEIASITQTAAGSASVAYTLAPVPAAGAALPPPQSSGSGHLLSQLFSVSCASATFCVAVGTYQDASGHDWALAETWQRGTTWVATSPPEPGSNAAEYGPGTGARQVAALWDVDCYAPGSCVAVGSYGDSDGRAWPMIDTLSNGSWSVTTVQVPGQAPLTDSESSWLSAVSCAPDGFCAAGGGYNDAAHSVSSGILADGYDNHWSSTAPPLPAGQTYRGEVWAVSCYGSSSCEALAMGSQTESLLAFADSNGAWTSGVVPMPPANSAGTPGSWFGNYFSISCQADGTCVATGNINDSGQWSSRPAVMTESGGSWTSAFAPLPSTPDAAGYPAAASGASLRGLACPAEGSCVAVGFYPDTGGGFWGLVETLNGGSWTAATVPDPSGSGSDSNPSRYYGVASNQYTGLFGVGCAPDGSCGAAGTYRTPAGYSALFTAHELSS